MRCLHALVMFPMLFAAASPVCAQSSRAAAAPASSQVERNSVDLKQGMSIEEVQRLLGKPRRTSLKIDNRLNTSSPAVLQWTYQWNNTNSSPGVLRIDFMSKGPESWYVNNWEWVSY